MKNYSKVYYKHPFSRLGGKREDPVDTHRLFPVLNAEQLLNIKGRINVVHQVRTQSGAPTDHFNALYKQLIDNFAEFVQNLPCSHNRHLLRVDRQLHFASLVLALREPYIVAGELLNRVTSNQRALWNYVAFSSILLSRLGELCTQYEVPLCDEKGNYERHWEPLLGSMNNQGSHYKIRSVSSEYSSMNKNLNALIAHGLIPLDGFLWIASDSDALEQWLIGLNTNHEEEFAGGGGLIAELYAVTEKWLIAQQHMIDEQLKLDYEKFLEELLEELILQHAQGEIPYLRDDNIQAGEAFDKWLKDGIKTDRLTINKKDAAVFVTVQGVVLLYPEIFEAFQRDVPKYANLSTQEVFNQYAKLGTVANGDIQSYITKIPGAEAANIQGVLLRDAQSVLQGKVEAVKQEVVRYAIEGRVGHMRGERFTEKHAAAEQQQQSAESKATQSDAEAKAAKEAGYPQLRFAQEAATNVAASARNTFKPSS